MSLVDTLAKRDQQEHELYELFFEIFNKCQAAGVVREDSRHSGETIFITVSGYKFSEFENQTDALKLTGNKYVGCGEYEYVSITIPHAYLDDINKFIVLQTEAYDRHEVQVKERLSVKEQQKQSEAERNERALYLKLKEKFETGESNAASEKERPEGNSEEKAKPQA